MKEELIVGLITGGLFSFIFIAVGVIAHFFPPKKINSIYGYRTNRSMKSIENWKFANSYYPKVMVISTVVSYTIYFLLLSTIGFSVGSKITLVAMLFIVPPAIITIVLTERKLKQLR